MSEPIDLGLFTCTAAGQSKNGSGCTLEQTISGALLSPEVVLSFIPTRFTFEYGAQYHVAVTKVDSPA